MWELLRHFVQCIHSKLEAVSCSTNPFVVSQRRQVGSSRFNRSFIIHVCWIVRHGAPMEWPTQIINVIVIGCKWIHFGVIDCSQSWINQECCGCQLEWETWKFYLRKTFNRIKLKKQTLSFQLNWTLRNSQEIKLKNKPWICMKQNHNEISDFIKFICTLQLPLHKYLFSRNGKSTRSKLKQLVPWMLFPFHEKKGSLRNELHSLHSYSHSLPWTLPEIQPKICTSLR